jgi:hypothetical protein
MVGLKLKYRFGSRYRISSIDSSQLPRHLVPAKPSLISTSRSLLAYSEAIFRQLGVSLFYISHKLHSTACSHRNLEHKCGSVPPFHE